MNSKLNRLVLALASTTILIAGCGGGGGGDSNTGGGGGGGGGSGPTTGVAVTVVDGAIQNATVCLDKNGNGACDSDEPSGRTDASGNVTLQVPNADLGIYPVLAVVGTDAVDADHGPVTQAFTLKAPADQTAVVSPLTTLVQATVEGTGGTSAAAEEALRAQLGINISLFSDFTKSSTTEAINAGAIARLVVVATQEQRTALSGAVGTTAIDGAVITQNDINKVVQQKILENLATLQTALTDPSFTSATTQAERFAAINTLASDIVSDGSLGLTTSNVSTVVGINNQSTSSGNDTPTAGASLRQLTFTSATSWFRRVFTFTQAQATPDASGNLRFVDRRARNTVGSIATWNTGNDPNRQSDLHWNGSSWVACALNQENISSVRDAQGRSTYDYCDKLETGSSTRATFDVSGRSMIDVYNQVRDANFTNLTIASAASALGSATFPSGSVLSYQVSTPLSTAPVYIPGASNVPNNANAAVAAGKTSPSDTTSACASITSTTPSSSYTTPATTLESLIAANPGTPCVFGPGTIVVSTSSGGTTTLSSGDRNEWWGQSSVSAGILGNAPTGGVQTSYYTTNTLLRLAFGGNNEVKYLACKQRSSDGSPRNCDLVGTGTYSVSTLGDARVLTLSNEPAQYGALNYNRIFVERGGKVHFGYKTKPSVANTARLNLTGTNALLAQLGIPAEDPATPMALTRDSFHGDWFFTSADGSDTFTVRLFQGGGTACHEGLFGAQFSCTVTVTPSTSSPGTASVTLTDNTNGGGGTGTLTFIGGAATASSTDGVNYTGARR